MDVKITVGDYEVISQGTVIGIPDTPISFHIQDIIINISFVADPEINGNPIRALATDNNKILNLEFVNHHNSLGTGNIKPLKIGTIDFRELMLNYRVYTLNKETMAMLHYTWLLSKEKEVKNG